MKFAIVLLLACVAVSQAAFTANLVQRAQPALQQALFKVRLASKSGSSTTSVIGQLEAQANGIMAQIQSAIENGQTVALEYINQLQTVASALSELGSTSYQQISTSIQNAFSGIWNQLFGGKSAFNLESIVNIISGYITEAQNLINNLPALLQLAAQTIINQITGKNSFSDILSLIQNVGSNALNSAQQIAGQVGGIFSGAWVDVQAIAQQFLNEGQSQISQLTEQATAAILNLITPLQGQLGGLFNEIVGQLTGVVSELSTRK